MARLTSIGVGGFKSIKDLQPLPLRPVNVFVGANGSGKSNLISFFRLLNAIPAGKLQEFIGRSGGANTLLYYGSKQTPALWIGLEFEGKTGRRIYFSWLKSTEVDSLIFSNETANGQVLGAGHRESLAAADESPELVGHLAGILPLRGHIRNRGHPEALQYRRQSRAA